LENLSSGELNMILSFISFLLHKQTFIFTRIVFICAKSNSSKNESLLEKKEADETQNHIEFTAAQIFQGHSDDAEYKGFAETPALYLRNALVNEYFGDLIKQRIVAIQFMGEKGLDTNKELAGAAGYLTSGLATTAEKPATEAWFSGLVGELDEAAISELKKDGAISFPGWV
jgi:hypothetical protein